MANVTYEKDVSALLVIDPYNDFISEGGKVWDRLKGIAEANQCVPHMLQVLDAGAELGHSRVLCATSTITALATTRRGSTSRPFRGQLGRQRPFEYGTWGGEIRNEIEPHRAISWA